jgi:streptogramin lyase
LHNRRQYKQITKSQVSIVAIVLLLTILFSSNPRIASLTALNTASFTSWTVPTPGSGTWALTLDQSGVCCWFLEYFGNKVGHFDPASSTFQEWTIPTTNSNPYSLAITSIAGTAVLWGTEFGSDKVFAFWPTSGIFREYSLPHGNTGVGYISIEPPGTQVRIWFTETIGNVNGEFLYDPATQNVTLYEDELPSAAGGGAYGVYAGSSTVWFAGYSALVRWDRALERYTIFPLPVHGSAVGRLLALDAYGQVWYTQGVGNGESGENFVGVLRGDAVIQEWRFPTIGSDPRGISINPLTQQPWIVEQSPAGNGTIAVLADSSGGTIVPISSSITTSGGTPIALAPLTTLAVASTHTVKPIVAPILGSTNGPFAEYSSGVTHPHDIVVDSMGNAWISEPESNKITRISEPSSDFALTASPPFVSLPRGGSGSVTVTGTSISGYAAPVTLATSSVATGVTISVSNPNLLIPSGGKAASNIAVNIAPNATAGISRIIIQGDNGSMNHAISVILMISNSTTGPLGKPQCLIATATYGSELGPEVEVLRNFRDNALKSRIGSSFLLMFNAWYYSFSPHVATYLSSTDHSAAREIMKVMLYPLIAILLLASNAYNSFSDHELAIALSGLLAASLIGAFYIGIPIGVFTRRPSVRILATSGVIFLGGVVMLLIGMVQNSATLLMFSSSIMVLSALSVSATLTAAVISRRSRILQVIRKPLE